MTRRRLDTELVSRRLASSRQVAQREIRSGSVVVDGAPVTKPSRLVGPAQELRLVATGLRYVSRSGEKLAAALDEFAVDVAGLRCLDVGSSTGGFTDCLLQRSAASVVAVDVGTGQLHDRLRDDARVTVLEQTDIRSVTPDRLGGPVELAAADLSFISLSLVVPTLRTLLIAGRPLIALVKPQFEAGRRAVAAGRGVIRDPSIWRRVLIEVVDAAASADLALAAAAVSPLRGASGNVEFVVQLVAGGPSLDTGARCGVLEHVVAEAEARGA